MNKVLRTIEQIALIVFPAIIAVMGVLNLSGRIEITKGVFEAIIATLGALITAVETAVAKDYINKG